MSVVFLIYCENWVCVCLLCVYKSQDCDLSRMIFEELSEGGCIKPRERERTGEKRERGKWGAMREGGRKIGERRKRSEGETGE